MQGISRILCPVDFSESSRHALDHAAMLAGWYRARVVALHVRHPALIVEPPVLAAELGELSASTLEDVEVRLHEWLRPLRASGITCELLAIDGHNPSVVIVEQAARIPADLIVLGTHGRSGFERLLLGSVAERVLRTAAVPVITVPPPAVATSTLPFKRILCGVDFSEPSMEGLRLALSFASESGAVVTMLHVVEYPAEIEPLQTLPFDMAAFRKAVEDDAMTRLMELAASESSAQQPLTKIMHGRAYEEILDAAAAERSDLIVLGVHGRNRLDLILFGSTANQVVRRAMCPVLTVRR